MSWRTHFLSRRLPLAIFGLCAAAAAASFTLPGAAEPGAAIAAMSRGSGVEIDESSFAWVYPAEVERTGPFDWHAAVFRARPQGESLFDVYTAELTTTAHGSVRGMRRLTDLSRTASGDEANITTSSDGLVAFSSHVDGAVSSVALLDFAGEPASLTADWSLALRVANGVTNSQRTGRMRGVAWKTFVFRDPHKDVVLRFGEGRKLEVRPDDGAPFEITRDGATTSTEVIVQESLKGKPAFLAWAVDTAREVPWIGPRKIEWLEKFWFDFNDWMARKQYEILGDDGVGATAEYAAMRVEEPAPGIAGWPPPAIAPSLAKQEPGEGEWVAVADPLFTPGVGGPPLFYRTFIRTDPERPFAPTHVIAWDPSRVELHMMAGVREPVSTTGLKGLGEVPREGDRADEITRLVGAFNGAFQAIHGEWGMALDRRYYLRPRPYGATIATYEDGRTAMGTWPDPVGEMPDGMRDMRQNVHPLVESGVFNPYKRVWWGGVPAGVEERVVTTRSGVCLTFDGKILYFWGDHLSPESLAAAMIAARCDYGVHLDMNSGHCGFELYRVDPVGGQPKASRELSSSGEAEGVVPRRPDLAFRAKKLVRQMAHMRFPRYIARDPRDFFYLLLRPSVFDRPPPADSKAPWRALGASARTGVPAVAVDLEDGRTLYKLDLTRTKLAIADAQPSAALLAVPFVTRAAGVSTGLSIGGVASSPIQAGESGLSIGSDRTTWLPPGAQGGDTVVQGLSMNVSKLVPASCALGVDADGYLLVATSKTGGKGLGELLAAAGVGDAMALIAPPESSGEKDRVRWLVFENDAKPDALRIFRDVQPVPPSVWREVYRRQGSALAKGDGEE